MPQSPDNINKVRKRGNILGLFFFKVTLRLFGLWPAYGLLYLVCIYYLFFDRITVKVSLSYIKRRFPGSGYFKQYLHVYLLFVNQGKQLIDKYIFISEPDKFNIGLQGYEEFKSLVQNSSKGVILLTAHVGNWQIAMSALKNLNKVVYLVMNPEDNAVVSETLQTYKEQDEIRIISSGQYLGGVVDIINKLKEGSVVSLMGDRPYGFKAFDILFLKDKAWFPYGAFAIAAAVECPVVILLSARVSNYTYEASMCHVIYPGYERGKDKHLQLRNWMQEFASILDEYVNRYPYQCFLFHDVWKEEKVRTI